MERSSTSRDLESGYPQPPLTTIHEDVPVLQDEHKSNNLVHSYSTGSSTVGTCGNGDDGDTCDDSIKEYVEVALPLSAVTTKVRITGGMFWRQETTDNDANEWAKLRCMVFLSATVFCIVTFALISAAVLLTGEESDTITLDLGGVSLGNHDDGYTNSFWNPVFDIRVVYDPNNPSQYILEDDKDVCHPTIVIDPDRTASTLDWSGVQPTGRSIAVLGILPHIQTSEDHFLMLSNSGLIELGPEKDWTLSFSGARLDRTESDAIDTIFLGEGSYETKSSLFEVCYDSNKSIRLGSWSSENGDDEGTISIPLPYPVTEFHVLTLTYSQKEGRLQVYQNTKLAADFEYRNQMNYPTTVSWIGPPHDDTDNVSSSFQNTSSNIALRHLAYLEKHIQAGSVVDIADVALHMST
jgi:hypothetical protein